MTQNCILKLPFQKVLKKLLTSTIIEHFVYFFIYNEAFSNMFEPMLKSSSISRTSLQPCRRASERQVEVSQQPRPHCQVMLHRVPSWLRNSAWGSELLWVWLGGRMERTISLARLLQYNYFLKLKLSFLKPYIYSISLVL